MSASAASVIVPKRALSVYPLVRRIAPASFTPVPAITMSALFRLPAAFADHVKSSVAPLETVIFVGLPKFCGYRSTASVPSRTSISLLKDGVLLPKLSVVLPVPVLMIFVAPAYVVLSV